MRPNNFVLSLITALCLICGGAVCEASPRRIVSLTPVGTEILFDLGQGGNVIAVTDFCDYPPEALEKPKIGGYAEINFEVLIAMKTDLLVLQDIHAQFAPQLEKLGIPYFIVRQNSVEEICRSIAGLGKICGAGERAEARITSIKEELSRIAKKTSGAERPKVMICVSRELSEQRINSFYVAGSDNFYNELIGLAGGRNVLKKTRAAYPYISVEGLLRLNPDVIIDLIGDRNFYHSKDKIDLNVVFDEKYLIEQWKKSASIDDAGDIRVSILEGTVYLRPGPRVGQVVLAFARAIHPEAGL